MDSLGEASLMMENPRNNEEHEVKFIIVPHDFECLLGLQTIQKLNFITVNSELYIGKVVRDLGDLGEVKLKTQPTAVPVALPARNIPLAIRDQVKQELNNLVDRGILIPVTEPILIPVTEPTEWILSNGCATRTEWKYPNRK